MKIFISMLRGINVGRSKRIRMDELVALYESLGFTNVKTYLQSGNIVFSSTEADPVQMSASIERQLSEKSSSPVKVILRGSDKMRQIIAANPFLREAPANTGALYMTFLADTPHNTLADTLQSDDNGIDRYVIVGKEVYLSCPKGYGRTKFSNTFFEKRLNVTATTRNWRTITALSAMADVSSGQNK